MPGYLCECKCGNKKIVSKYDYNSGKTRSCGCLIREFNSKRGQYYDGSCYGDERLSGIDKKILEKIFNSYKAMMARCTNPLNHNYPNYGGRGICVCDEWVKDKAAFVIWSVKNGFEIGKSIDRIDVNGNYEPGNCRYITQYEQARNTRRNVYIKYNGVTYIITDLAKKLGVPKEYLSPLAKKGIELRGEV
jgi:hypothetical protein